MRHSEPTVVRSSALTRKGRRGLMWAFRRRTMGPDLGFPVEDEQPISGQIRASGALLCIRRVPLSLATSSLFYHCIDFSVEYAIQSHHDRNEIANDRMNKWLRSTRPSRYVKVYVVLPYSPINFTPDLVARETFTPCFAG